jgi:hypothetical protein
LLHVAAALECGAQLFLSFDKRQRKLAKATPSAIRFDFRDSAYPFRLHTSCEIYDVQWGDQTPRSATFCPGGFHLLQNVSFKTNN